MSPKIRTRQPRRAKSAFAASIGSERPPEGLFWARTIHPATPTILRAGQNLTLQVGDRSVTVLRGIEAVGVLEPEGEGWVRTRGYSSCVFVKYGVDPTKRFQVRIAAR